MKKHITTCTQNGMTKSQPGMCVSTSSYGGVVILNVYRSRNIKNSFGGIGRAIPCDANGMVFKDSDTAFNFALERGYLQRYYTPMAIRKYRAKEAVNPRLKIFK